MHIICNPKGKLKRFHHNQLRPCHAFAEFYCQDLGYTQISDSHRNSSTTPTTRALQSDVNLLKSSFGSRFLYKAKLIRGYTPITKFTLNTDTSVPTYSGEKILKNPSLPPPIWSTPSLLTSAPPFPNYLRTQS